MDQRSDESREVFARLSAEYADALQALDAIERQASTLVLLGNSEELTTFLEQFLDMARRARALAAEHEEPHFTEWFDELIGKAEALRRQLVTS